jgi:hypothetical protein
VDIYIVFLTISGITMAVGKQRVERDPINFYFFKLSSTFVTRFMFECVMNKFKVKKGNRIYLHLFCYTYERNLQHVCRLSIHNVVGEGEKFVFQNVSIENYHPLNVFVFIVE